MNAINKINSDKVENSLRDVQERIRQFIKSNSPLEDSYRRKAF
jgi:hypothetical protein